MTEFKELVPGDLFSASPGGARYLRVPLLVGGGDMVNAVQVDTLLQRGTLFGPAYPVDRLAGAGAGGEGGRMTIPTERLREIATTSLGDEHREVAAELLAARERLEHPVYVLDSEAQRKAEQERDAARAEVERLRLDVKCAAERESFAASTNERLRAELDAARAEIERTEAALSTIWQWTIEHGAALCPKSGCADTYGEGMRMAKREVAKFLAREPRFCKAPHPIEDRRCQLPYGHDGDHQQAGMVDGVRWTPQADPSDAEIEAAIGRLRTADRKMDWTDSRLAQDELRALMRRGRGDQRLREAADYAGRFLESVCVTETVVLDGVCVGKHMVIAALRAALGDSIGRAPSMVDDARAAVREVNLDAEARKDLEGQ